jgi:hypothetical protein
MAYQEILNSEIEAGAPLDALTLSKIQGNFDYLKANIGAGGGGFEWSNELANGAVEVGDKGLNVVRFDENVSQAVKSMVNVPSGFEGGIKPTMKISIYCPLADNTKDIYLGISVGLIKGTNAADNPTSIYAGNVTVENSSVAGDIQVIEIDLSSASGIIDGESIAANDQLSIELTRKGDDALDTALESVYMISSLTEVKFS